MRTRSPRGAGASLREDIIEAATALMAESGDAVSVRAIADRVGVSTPSLYLHFEDRQAIIDAVCEGVWAQLGGAMEEAAVGVDSPMESLKRRGIAYVRFGLANPEHYRIVMMDRRAQPEIDDVTADMVMAHESFSHLLDAVQLCIDEGVFAQGVDPMSIGLQLWAAAHGLTSLVIAKATLPWPDLELLVEQMMDAIGAGLAATNPTTDQDRDR